MIIYKFKIFKKNKALFILLISLNNALLLSNSSFADIPIKQQHEIDHLLNFIAKSACQFNRNGTYYSGIQSRQHIQKKYNYFKDNIKSAEDFIHYSATKSTISRKYYTVQCPNKEKIKSKNWLLNELKQFRSIE